MPGSQVRDANAVNLLTGATISSAGTTDATGTEVDRPGLCRLVINFGTVTGTNPTFKATLQGSDTSDFSAGNVTYGTIGATSGTAAAQSSTKRSLIALVYAKYVRLTNVVLAGTSPVYTGATAYLEQPHYQQVAVSDTAS